MNSPYKTFEPSNLITRYTKAGITGGRKRGNKQRWSKYQNRDVGKRHVRL